MSAEEEKELLELYAQWGIEERKDLVANDVLGENYAYRSFVSGSNGRGRSRRKDIRFVELILNRRG